MFHLDWVVENLRKRATTENTDRCDILKTYKVDKDVLKYLEKRLKNLGIEIGEELEGRAIDLMKKEYLEGYCWQTTESSVIFLNEKDYIERGILKLRDDEEYYHSWICFKYHEEEYVFDPCLNLICLKSIYHKILEAKIKGVALAQEVHQALVERIQKQGETVARTPYEMDDPNAPLYRNNATYKAEIEKGKIRKLVAYYPRQTA